MSATSLRLARLEQLNNRAANKAALAQTEEIGSSMSGKDDESAMGFGGREMTSLHDVVLDYLESHAYASTARVLVQPSPDHIPASSNGVESGATAGGEAVMDDQMDIDSGMGTGAGSKNNDAKAWSEERLLSIDRRRDIINMILNGAIMRAVESLNTHFTAVLDDASSSSLDNKGKSAVSSNGASVSSSKGRPTRLSYSSYSAPDATNGSAHPHAQLDDGVRRASGGTWAFGSSLNGQTDHGHSNHNGNGSGNGHTKSWHNGQTNGSSVSDDHALPVMHRSLHPAHVKLNLSIQAFIESFRQLAPSSSPSTPSSSIGDLGNSINMSMSQSISNAGGGMSGTNGSGSGAGPSASASKHSNGVTLTNALTAAQGLHAEAKKLEPEDRAVYLQEIKDVGALLAYTDPETSILKGFLEQSRRIALAEQVNRAILVSEGHLPFSQLELYARRTTASWALMAEKHVDNVPNWTAADGLGKEQLSALIKRQTRPGRGFSLRDYVADSLI